MRRIYNGKTQSTHHGLDYSAALGTEIKAANSGRAAIVRDMYFEGGLIVIDHGESIFTLYMHLSEFLVPADAAVTSATLPSIPRSIVGMLAGRRCGPFRPRLGCPTMLLEGKKLLITGVLTPQSIAFAAATSAQQHGAEIVLTNFGRAVSLTQTVAKRLPQPCDVLEMDVNDEAQIDAVEQELASRWVRVDGILHAIAFAPQDALGGNFLNTPWDSVATAVQTSAFSLKSVAVGLLPLMREHGGSVVSLDFDGQVAWPVYDWMGVAKAGLEAVTRYLARDLGAMGIRVNTVSAGPIRTMAGKGIPGFDEITGSWGDRAPLGWDAQDPAPVGDTVTFLFSDLARGITGELIHVDGGFHAIGTTPVEARN